MENEKLQRKTWKKSPALHLEARQHVEKDYVRKLQDS